MDLRDVGSRRQDNWKCDSVNHLNTGGLSMGGRAWPAAVRDGVLRGHVLSGDRNKALVVVWIMMLCIKSYRVMILRT